MKKKALIFGITGQDGSYLTEFLINKGYIVHGVKRRSSSFNTSRLDHLISINNLKTNNSLDFISNTNLCIKELLKLYF